MATEALRHATPTMPAHYTASEEVACAHCGLPVPEGLVDAGAAQQFCCAGCSAVFAILHEHGLDRYYDFAERREAPVRSSGRSYEEFDHSAFAERYVRAQANGIARTELYLEG